MKRMILSLILLFFGTFCAYADIAQTNQTLAKLESQGIKESTDPKIRELYEKIKKQIDEYTQLQRGYVDDLRENATAMRDKEQSTENKLLGAASMGATGIGAMQAMSATAEQSANDAAERDMAAYLATFTCNYGAGKNVRGGETAIELPVGNELIALVAEYKALAADLKIRKVALGMQPGIESETILDSATAGLYDDTAIGKTDGAYTSISRALLDENSDDAAAIAQQKSDTADKKKTGTTMAAVGAIGGTVGNMIINKNAPKERSEEIKNEHSKKIAALESEISASESELNALIADNQKKIDEYNALLAQHKDFVATMTESECQDQFREYIEYINSLNPITDKFADTSNLSIKYDLDTQKSEYTKCTDAAALRRKIAECESIPHHTWIDGECVDQTPPATEITNPEAEPEPEPEPEIDPEAPITPVVSPDTDTDPNQCPAENPRMRSLNENNYVGDFCSYGNVVSGKVFKRKDGTCSCTALSCINGYEVKGGVCKKIVADENGVCLRTEHDKVAGKNDNTNLCIAFCKKYATDNKCTYKSVIMSHSTGKCICNPEQAETDAVNRNNERRALEKRAKNAKYYHVCMQTTGAPANRRRCISTFSNIQVQLLQGVELAKLYTAEHYKDELVCSGEIDWTHGNDDYTNCMSITSDDPYYYSFRFDDLVESWDMEIEYSVKRALCEDIYGGKFSGTVCNNMAPDKANRLVQKAGNFAINATKTKDTQVSMASMDSDTYTTNKIAGVDPFAFYSGSIQIQAKGKMIDGLYEYVALQLAPTAITKFTCDANPRQISSKIDGRGTQGSSDDVLTCYANGQKLDFVFDDMSEFSDTLSYGGYSNMNCTVVGGAFNGRECMNIGKNQCERIKKMGASDPVVKQARWNESTQRCELPAASDATDMQQNIQIGVMVGGIIVGAVVTVATGGTAAPALALLAVETAGGVMEITQTQKIYKAIDDFLNESQKCKNATCAEQMLKSDLQRMSNMTFDMTDAQINGVDSELARLASLIPSDSDFYQKIIANGTSTAANSKGFFDPASWEPEQVWRAVGVALQMTSLITSIGKWIAGKVNKLPRVTRAIQRGAQNASDASRALPAPRDPNIGGGGAGARAGNGADNAAHSASTADNAARTAGNNAMHSDLAAYRAAPANQKKSLFRKMALKYHPDKVSRESAELQTLADDIMKDLNNIDNLSDTELQNLSRKMHEFDRQMNLANAADTGANNADNATRNAGASANAASNAPLTGAALRAKASKNFDSYLAQFKNTGVNKYGLPKSRMTDAEWARLNDELAPENIRMVQYTKDGQELMKFDYIDTPTNNAANAARGARQMSKAEKIANARQSDNLGYHGTDANISMDDMIRPSANTSGQLGTVGYGIAKDYTAAQRYAIKRLIERQNPGKRIKFFLENNVLVVQSDQPLNLGNKTGYVYTTAKNSEISWNTLHNGYVGSFDAAQMPNAVEILEKTEFNLDDLIRSGQVRIIQ